MKNNHIFCLRNKKKLYFCTVKNDGLVAQLDRVPDYGSGGCGFDSRLVHEKVLQNEPFFILAHSTRGLGHLPLTQATAVRIRYGLQIKSQSIANQSVEIFCFCFLHNICTQNNQARKTVYHIRIRAVYIKTNEASQELMASLIVSCFALGGSVYRTTVRRFVIMPLPVLTFSR